MPLRSITESTAPIWQPSCKNKFLIVSAGPGLTDVSGRKSMSRFIIYTILRLKAVMKIFPSMCVMTLLLCLSLGGMLYLQSARSLQFSEGDEDATVSIGISGVDDSGAFSAAFPALLQLDSSRSEVSFIMYDTKKDAVKAIRKGDIVAAIDIPDGVVGNLLAGQMDQMTLIVPSSSAGLEALIMRELSLSVSTILGSMNSAGNVLSDYYKSSGTSDPQTIADAQTDLLLTSMQDMLHRKHMFQMRYVKSENQLSIESFYLVSMVLLLFLLTGVMCAGSFIRSDYSLSKLLSLRRLGSLGQVIAEFISLVALLVCLSALFLPLIGAALSRMPITFSAFGLTSTAFMKGFGLFCLRCVPVILLAASLDLLLYELSRTLITGVLLQFLVMISLAYLSGVFYTVQTLPESLKVLQPFLPTGQALLYMQYAAKNKSADTGHLPGVLLWTLLLLAGSFLLRRSKVTGKRGGK